MAISRTTLKPTAAALGVVALFAAAAAAGVSRGEEMRTSGAAANAPDKMAVRDTRPAAPQIARRP